MLTMIPNTQGKRSSPSGGRIRSSCGYHHQRHQACHDTCEGRKTHPPKEHPPVRDKFAVGCVACQAYFSEQHQEILSPVSKRLVAQAHVVPSHSHHQQHHHQHHSPNHHHNNTNNTPLHHPPSNTNTSSNHTPQTPHTPEQQLTTHHSFNTTSKFDEFTSIAVCSIPNRSSPVRSPARSPSSSPPHTPKLASLTHEVEYELLQQHQHELTQKHRLYEQEEQLLLQYRQQLDKMRQQQDTERQRIQQQQQVLDYQKQQQELELQRIHQYQLELDDVRREQELQRHLLKQQQVEITQARMGMEQKKQDLLFSTSSPSSTSSNPSSSSPLLASLASSISSLSSSSLFMPLVEKSHSPNPTTRVSHSMEEENAARDLMQVHVTSLKRPLSDIMGNESEEASHKSNTRRSG